MANVIEILVQAKDQFSATFNKTKDALDRLNTSLAKVGLSYSAIKDISRDVGTAIAEFTTDIANQAEQLSNLSKVTGVSTTNLQVIRRALVEAGGNAEDASVAFVRLSSAIAQGTPLLGQLGVTSKDTYQAMFQLADGLQKVENPAQRQAAAFQLLGRNSYALNAVLSGGSKEIEAFAAALQKSGNIIDQQTLSTYLKLDQAIDEATRSFEAFRMQVAQYIIPVILGLSDALSKLVSIVTTLPSLLGILSTVAGSFGDALDSPLKAFGIFEKAAQSAGAQSVKLAGQLADIKKNFRSLKDGAVFFSQSGKLQLDFGGGGGGAGASSSSASSSKATFADRQTALLDRIAKQFGFLDNAEVQKATSGLARVSGQLANDPGTSYTDSGLKIKRALDLTEQYASQFGQRLAGNFNQVFSRLTQIVTNSNNIIVQLFAALGNAILQTLTEAFAQLAAQSIVKALVSVIPIPGLSLAAGSKSVPVAGDFGAAPVVNQYINTLDAKSYSGFVNSPTGNGRYVQQRQFELLSALR